MRTKRDLNARHRSDIIHPHTVAGHTARGAANTCLGTFKRHIKAQHMRT